MVLNLTFCEDKAFDASRAKFLESYRFWTPILPRRPYGTVIGIGGHDTVRLLEDLSQLGVSAAVMGSRLDQWGLGGELKVHD
jgi:hypothetical protein